ncbi:putative quinone oxidoreductase [Pseudovirgaria hyperparasitica]|uniref:Putative quinone oxidoreductase n=1 Tax=Pseudovirgaria hyperparasitica TaxID=470096 RepID=A0A6A6VWX6_9PEZI|nr:putative quinone oxidoreductase [Pseudovirgaria hyperparasitica]KAF2754214.1 putative quinone oxidoreductase [Pseudovirgaria hyperparasitica]
MSNSKTSAQLQLTQRGGPFKVAHVPTPTPGPDEVLIRQRAIALNLVDVKQRDLGIGISRWPHVLGIEGAGIVEAVGSNVRHVRPGDEVAAWEGSGAMQDTWGGAYQESVVVPAYLVFKRPHNISLEEAASLPICFTTAVSAIYNSLSIPLPFLTSLPPNGELPSSVLVLGGSSATGASAIQLLRKACPDLPIVVTSSSKHSARLKGLGATSVVDYKSPAVITDIRRESPNGAGVDMILDCVSAGASQTDICNVFYDAGPKRYVAVVTGVPVPVPEDVTLLEANAWTMMGVEGGNEIIASLTKLVEGGIYRTPLPVRNVGHGLETLPDVLDEVVKASGEKLLLSL